MTQRLVYIRQFVPLYDMRLETAFRIPCKMYLAELLGKIQVKYQVHQNTSNPGIRSIKKIQVKSVETTRVESSQVISKVSSFSPKKVFKTLNVGIKSRSSL